MKTRSTRALVLGVVLATAAAFAWRGGDASTLGAMPASGHADVSRDAASTLFEIDPTGNSEVRPEPPFVVRGRLVPENGPAKQGTGLRAGQSPTDVIAGWLEWTRARPDAERIAEALVALEKVAATRRALVDDLTRRENALVRSWRASGRSMGDAVFFHVEDEGVLVVERGEAPAYDRLLERLVDAEREGLEILEDLTR